MGSGAGAYHLGLLYRKGTGVDKDAAKAEALFVRAHELGCSGEGEESQENGTEGEQRF